MEKFPRQQNGEGGWTICPKFLGSLIRSMEESDFRPCMEEAEQVLLALERLNEVVHDSDCAMHNMPAMPNGECDCIALELQKYVDSDRQKTNEINILTKENRRLSDEIFFSGNINQFFPHMDIIDQQNIMIAAYNKWGTENTPHREKMAFLDGFNAAMLLIEGEK